MSGRALVSSWCRSRQLQRPTTPLRTLSGLAQASDTKETPTPVSAPISFDEIKTDLEGKPTWSVESLLPLDKQAPDAPEITSQQLNHLLRLSALPLPKSQQEENRMLSTLSDQLHFVGKIQQVDTTGVKPLRAIRDETAAFEAEQTITLKTLKNAFAHEKVVGKHYKRIQRDTAPADAYDVESWNVLGSAERKLGRYFVVESERPQQ